MKSMRGMVLAVAGLAMLSVASASSAAVITLQPVQYGTHGAYAVYVPNTLSGTLGGGKQLYLKYDLSAIQTAIAGGEGVVSAKLAYVHYTENSGWLVQGAAEVVQATVDPTTDVSTKSTDPIHAALINNSTEVMQGLNLSFTNEVVTDLGYDGAYLYGGYGGLQYVDVLAIVNSWLGGAANYGLGIDTVVAGYTTGLAQHHLRNYVYLSTIPYLEITTAPVPEPASMVLLAMGGLAMLKRRWVL